MIGKLLCRMKTKSKQQIIKLFLVFYFERPSGKWMCSFPHWRCRWSLGFPIIFRLSFIVFLRFSFFVSHGAARGFCGAEAPVRRSAAAAAVGVGRFRDLRVLTGTSEQTAAGTREDFLSSHSFVCGITSDLFLLFYEAYQHNLGQKNHRGPVPFLQSLLVTVAADTRIHVVWTRYFYFSLWPPGNVSFHHLHTKSRKCSGSNH